jgi:hypothetical protein
MYKLYFSLTQAFYAWGKKAWNIFLFSQSPP